MQTIGGLLAGVCFAAALGGVVLLLSPGGSSERLLRLIAALFVLAAAVVPLRTVVRETIAEPAQAQTDEAVQAVLQNAARAIEQTAHDVLEKYGYTDASVHVTAYVRDGEVHAQRFDIDGVEAKNAQEIAHEIFTLTGELPRITAAADGG